MKKLRVLFSLLLFLTFGGCASFSFPSAEEFAKADFGKYPTTHKTLIKETLQTLLIHPASAKYRLANAPKKDFITYTYSFGYRVCYIVSTKDTSGLYTAEKYFYFFIKNDKVMYYILPPNATGVAPYDLSLRGLYTMPQPLFSTNPYSFTSSPRGECR